MKQSSKWVIICLILLIFFSSHNVIFAEEDNQHSKQIKIEIKEDKNLEKGIRLLNNGKYENAALFFEKFLLTNSEIFDQLVGLGAISFGGFKFKLDEGVKYFKEKIKRNPKNYYALYFIGIFRIIGLELEDKASNYLEKVIKSKLNFSKIHYMLGLAYLFQGELDLYKKQCIVLQKQNIYLANRLTNILDTPSFFLKNFLESIVKDKNLQVDFK